MSELRPEEGSEEIPEEKPDSDGVETEDGGMSEPELEEGSEETPEEETHSDGSETEDLAGFKPKPLSDY